MLIDRIKADALTARKAKSPVASVLVTLIGEIDTRTKTLNPARAMTDDEVLGVVRKFLKGIHETLRILTPALMPADKSNAAIEKALAEKIALEAYLPVQMSAGMIEEFARARISEGADLGAVMAALKAGHGGQYDGKLASGMVRDLIAASNAS